MKFFKKIEVQKQMGTVKKYKLCGCTVLKKYKSPTRKKTYVLGIRVKCKEMFVPKNKNNLQTRYKFTHFQIINKYESYMSFPKFENPEVSIIIPVYNNYEYTMHCLKSILDNTTDVSYEVIIADDNSTDETKKILDFVQNIKVVRNSENLRFLKNCNNASKQAIGKYILFLNNDTQVQKGWLSALVNVIANDQSIGMVGSKLIYPDGKLQEAGGIIYSDANSCNYGRGDNPNKLHYNYVKEVDYISGASIMLKKELWDELGGFDERFVPAYYEDTDLAFQVRYNKGLKVVYVPKSVVVHFEGKSNGTDVSSGQKHYQIVNREKFYDKWKNELYEFHVNRFSDNLNAKDRGQNKKNILVIDWKILSFSKDTGSRTTWQYMNFFKDLGMNVKFFPHDFYIEDDYLEQHLDNGFEVIDTDFKIYISQYGKYIDYVYINRPNISCFYIELVRKYTNAKIIYQCHDLHYLRQYRTRIINKDLDAESLLEKEKKFEFDVMERMDVVCSFSYDEVQTIQQENKYINAIQIPLYILDSNKMDQYSYIANERKDIMFVAGFGHAPNIDAAVWFVNEIFPEIKKQHPEIKLYLVGSKPTDEVLALQSKDIIVTGFVTDEELDDYYSKIKLVVVPLRTGAGVKGKIIESLYHKVPVITTPIGIEGINNEQKIIDVCDDANSFSKKVIERYNDDSFLTNQSNQCKNWIHEYFSKDAVINSFQNTSIF